MICDEHEQRPRDQERVAIRVAQGERLRHQLADHELEEHDHDDDQHERRRRDRARRLRSAPRAIGSSARAAERRRRGAERGDADLDRREEPLGMIAQRLIASARLSRRRMNSRSRVLRTQRIAISAPANSPLPTGTPTRSATPSPCVPARSIPDMLRSVSTRDRPPQRRSASAYITPRARRSCAPSSTSCGPRSARA